jgi:hypothetical protein
LTVPAFEIVSMPVALSPTIMLVATAFGPSTTVGLGVIVSMATGLAAVGNAPGLQFPAINQSFDVAPVQSAARAAPGMASTPVSAKTRTEVESSKP